MFCHAHDPLSLASVLLMVDSYHVPNQEMEMTVTDDRSTTHRGFGDYNAGHFSFQNIVQYDDEQSTITTSI